MMHELDALLCGLGGFIAGLMMCTALFCSQEWVLWVMACGTALALAGLALDHWRTAKYRR